MFRRNSQCFKKVQGLLCSSILTSHHIPRNRNGYSSVFFFFWTQLEPSLGEPGGRGFPSRKEDLCPGSERSQEGKYLLMSHWGIKNPDIPTKSGG